MSVNTSEGPLMHRKVS